MKTLSPLTKRAKEVLKDTEEGLVVPYNLTEAGVDFAIKQGGEIIRFGARMQPWIHLCAECYEKHKGDPTMHEATFSPIPIHDCDLCGKPKSDYRWVGGEKIRELVEAKREHPA